MLLYVVILYDEREDVHEAGPRKELFRIAIILRGRLGDNLFQVDRKFVRVERSAFFDLPAGFNDFIPRIHATPAYSLFNRANNSAADFFNRQRLAYATDAYAL